MATPKIGVQLYSVREHLAVDFDGTVATLAAIGLQGVETAFFDPATDFAAAAESFARHGLQVAAAHVAVPIGADREATLAQAAALGTSRIIWHGWPRDARYSTLAGIKEMVAEYREAGKVAADNGLRFGIHNHWWELERVDGLVPLQILAEELDSSVFFELDTYWSTVAGWTNDVVVPDLLDGRVETTHIKDGPADDVDAPMVALGEGAVDLDTTLAATAGAEWWIVELDDCATDMLEAIEKSVGYLLARGSAA